jgi:hypothetical protein
MLGVSEPDLFTFCLLALGGPLLGLSLLLNAGRPRTAAGRWTSVALWLGLCCLGVGAAGWRAAGGEPAGRWLPPAALGLLFALLGARLSPRGGRLLGALAGARLQGLLLLLALPLAALGWSGWLENQSAPLFAPSAHDAHGPGEPVADPAVRALTDLGQSLPLYRVDGSIHPERLAEWEHDVLRHFVGKVLRTAEPDPHYNCHGWVFAAGRHWVLGRDVPAVLQDNGYRKVSDPRPGDVIVYREADGAVAHSGLVRSITSEGQVLIESKWGWFGRFLHAPQVQGYGTSFAYYRSARTGHSLRIYPAEAPQHTEP